MMLMVSMYSFSPLPNCGSSVAGSVGTATFRVPVGPEALAAGAGVAPGLTGPPPQPPSQGGQTAAGLGCAVGGVARRTPWPGGGAAHLFQAVFVVFGVSL